MVVTGKYLCIALFVVLQITVGLCRSTESPLNQDKGSTVKVNTDKAQNADVVPNVMSQDDLKKNLQLSWSREAQILNTIEIIVILSVVFFVLGSLITGFILMCCFPPKPRPGVILMSNTTLPSIQLAGAGK